MRIYVSSTSLDLEAHRRAVVDAILRSGHTPVCMEHHAAGDVAPVDESLQQVATCEAYVGIFAQRYGFIPPRCEASITEMEYREATKIGIPTLVFLSAETTKWPLQFEESGEKGRRIQALREELKLTKWVRFFTSPDNLAAEVLSAIIAEMIRRAFEKARSATPDDVRQQQRAIRGVIEEQARAIRSTRLGKRQRFPSQAPQELTRHFHGRATELAKLRQCLGNRNLRMVSVCGRGGMGKTTLVLKLVNELTSREETSSDGSAVDSVVYVPLGESAFRTPDRIVELIACTLESEASSELNDAWNRQGSSLRERLAAVLRGPLSRCRTLVVLDNLESVLDDENRMAKEYSPLGEFIEAFLKHDHVSLLVVTTRGALTLSTDAEIAAIGRRVQISLDEGLPQDSAIALIRELDSDGRLGIRSATEEVLGTVVRRCQGIPRTIEAFVGTLLQRSTWTLDTLLANEPLMARLIEDPARELFANLSSNQQLVTQALAVYDQPVPSGAVRSILPALPIDDILDNLVKKLVARYDRGRYWLHPLDRLYAYGQIPDRGGEYSKQVLHKLAAQFFRSLRRPVEQCKTIHDLEPQLSEFQHLVHAEYFDDACRLLNEIDREYLATWGYAPLVIKLRIQLVGRITDRHLQGLNAGNLGSAHFDTGDAVKAKEYFEQALGVARETGDRALEGRWMGNLGLACSRLGSREPAIDLLNGALVIAREIGDRRHENRWLGSLTRARLTSAEIGVQDAVENFQRAISLARDVSDQRFVMIWTRSLGDVFLGLGDLTSAKEQVEFALEAARQIGAREEACRILLQLGMICGNLGETSQQAESFEQACEALGEIQNSAEKGNVLIKLAAMYADLGDQQRQLQCYDDALKVASEIGDRAAERRLLLRLGDVWRKIGNDQKTEECYRLALDKARRTPDVSDECNALLRLAALSIEGGQKQAAIEHYEQALQRVRQTPDRAGEAVVLSAYANALLSAGEPMAAIRYYEAALPIVSEMNDKTSQSHIFNRLGMAAHLIRDIPQAVVYYEKMLEIARETGDREGQAVALHNIGGAYHVAGEIAQAMSHYQDALALSGPSLDYKCALGLGTGCLQIGKRQDALGHFEQCIRLVSDKTHLSFHPELAALGVSLIAIGRTEEGIEIYRRGLKLGPSREDLIYAIEDLRFLEGVEPPIAGLVEAIDMLVKELTLGVDPNQSGRASA